MWPEGARVAVSFTFDFDAEEVWVADDPSYESRPVGLSQGAYGAKVAVPAILELLARHGISATFFVPGKVAEDHPDRVREIVEAGHELACHGYRHRHPARMTLEEEVAELARAREVLDAFGVPVVGYRAPGWDLSMRSLDLVARAGFTYSSNFMDRLHPYVHPEGLVELPVSWLLDDAPHFWFDAESWTKKIATTSEVREIWEEELLGIREVGGVCVLTMHPQVIGRPSRLRFLDAFMGWTLGLGDAWVATCGQIAGTVRDVA